MPRAERRSIGARETLFASSRLFWRGAPKLQAVRCGTHGLWYEADDLHQRFATIADRSVGARSLQARRDLLAVKDRPEDSREARRHQQAVGWNTRGNRAP